ncbi:MAG: adenylosuccinate synthase [Candidatus Dormibacteraeota bacterium]|nr:adenylosuccinate synthase [Candidatus Dormibacteraeota bacterium]
MVIVIVGGQWGDEGKGKVIDYLAEQSRLVIRPQGGNNAGHTVITAHGEFKFQLLPSGILYPDVTCVIGNGVVVDPRVLIKELDQLRERGIEPDNLVISERAHMVMSFHPVFDKLEEGVRGDDRLGTTWRGVGPAYGDKVRRIGFRIGDLQKEAFMRKKIDFVVGQVKNPILDKLYGEPQLDLDAIHQEYLGYAKVLDPYIKDTFPIIQGALDRGDNMLLEGAQATMLDLDFGTYPYVTGSNPTAGGAVTGSGVPPTRLDLSLLVLKAYTTRVGYGPFPTELEGRLADAIRERGHEFGTVTGRARRVGWFDAAVAGYAARLNGAGSIALMKLDILDELHEIRICSAYDFRGERHDHPMANISHLKHCEPVYEQMPGWQSPTGDCRRWEELPVACRDYVTRLEELCGAPIDLIGVGPRRDQFVTRRDPWSLGLRPGPPARA